MKKLLLVVAFLATGAAWATPGAVDGKGCHNSTKIGFHCHPQRAGSGSGGHETEAQKDKRLRRECKGRGNGGACLGYGSF